MDDKVKIEMTSNDSQGTAETQEILKWLDTIENLRPRKDPDFVKKFLIGSKYNVPKTKQRILCYYQNRKKYSDILTNRDILEPKIIDLFNRGIFVCDFDPIANDRPLRIYSDLSRIKDEDDAKAIYHLGFIMVETLLLVDNVVKEGTEWIANLKGVPLSFIIQLTPKLLYSVVKCVLVGMPIRLKAIHFINIHPAIMAAIHCIKAFLTPKLRSRLHVNRHSWSSLHKYIPKQHIPLEYEGTGGLLQDYLEKNRELLLSSRDYLLDDEQYGFE